MVPLPPPILQWFWIYILLQQQDTKLPTAEQIEPVVIGIAVLLFVVMLLWIWNEQ